MLLLLTRAQPAAAQNSRQEFWPKISIHLQLGPRARAGFEEYIHGDHTTQRRQGSFSYYLDYALRPVFRRELRDRDDVFRQRYLTFRAGYLYRTALTSNDTTVEHWAIAEATARYPTRGKIVIVNRNRGEFRFIEGQPFSMRYRNRLWVERDLGPRGFVFTPYIYGEIFYDTRNGDWPVKRAVVGVQIPAGPHVVFEPYVVRQNDSRSTPSRVNALGLTLNLYF